MIVLGSRGSELALWQARYVQGLLAERVQLPSRIEVIRTAGDREPDVGLARLEGKGFFTKEIEEALLRGEIDLAVHSHKDLPTESPAGLTVAAVPERGPAADCLLIHPEAWEESGAIPLREGASVGTGSARRSVQLLSWRPDLEIRDLRGNLTTRIRKVTDRQYDAAVLAKAGLQRLGISTDPLRIHEFVPTEFVPAPAQGALAVQMRSGPAARAGDRSLAQALTRLHHAPTARLIAAERLLLAALEGGCRLPLGAYAAAAGERIQLVAVLGLTGGGVRRCEVCEDSPEEAARLAKQQLTVGGLAAGPSPNPN